MKMLKHLLHESNYAKELSGFAKELNDIENLVTSAKTMLSEDMSADTDNLFDETFRMLQAAKRGLGIANTLKNPGDRARYKSRIMSNLNRLRGQLNRIQKAIAATNEPTI